MRFVTPNDGLIFPEASVTGEQGELLDTCWDVHWPGPARVYLHDRDTVDILVASLDRPLVIDALQVNGWTAPGDTAAQVALFEEELERVRAERDEFSERAAAFETTIRSLGIQEGVTA